MLLQLAAFFLCYTSLVSGQQRCNYVTITSCDGDVTTTAMNLVRGPKGDAGLPGNVGPSGISGRNGDKGAVGQKGDVLDLEPFNREMRIMENKIREINNQAESITQRLIEIHRQDFREDGWTVFQRRFNGSVVFGTRVWQEYKNGFGNFNGEFWLGLDEIHRLTSGRLCRLHVNLVGFDGSQAFAEYSSFAVDDESDNYRLHVSGYNGTAGDSLAYHDGIQFSTTDRKHDRTNWNCALQRGYSGGWWYNACFHSALNAEWGSTGDFKRNIIWQHWKGVHESIKESTMKIKCH
uniref:Ficolin-2-like n=1 Tax=Phallusia mammillata TaxID=59560 RepID=A0A6F9DC53_9ASCI|nr:ficolin-2-like [Phallusia mammillata]